MNDQQHTTAIRVIRHADWLISPEQAPEAPAITFEFQCTSCDEVGSCDEDFEAARSWTFDHIMRNPSHTGYRELIHRFWRMGLAE